MRVTTQSSLKAALAALLFAITSQAAVAQPSVESRVGALLSQMTLEEKVGQLNLISHGPPLRWDDILEGKSGALLNFNNAADVARAQALAHKSRLGIPPLFGLDIVHGFRTQFPVPLGEAAAFNPELSRLSSEWAAKEATYVGVNWTFAPMADLSRDSRWGRIVEGFGEDPYLGSILTAARVEGFRAGGLATATKHFAGYGAPQGGRDYDTTYIPPAEMYDTYLPPFRAALEAGSVSFMAAFNALNGIPSAANPWLLSDVLRGQWGFDEFVTSDWASIYELLGHGIAADGAEAARKAFLAGVDMDMMGQLYIKHLPAEVRAGRVPEAVVDEAVRRVLRTKVRMGLFETPDIDPTRTDAVFPTAESRAAAREVARETFVLLQNRGDTLPINPKVKSIAIVGPLADAPRDQIGPHGARGHAQDSVTVLKGLRDRASAAGIATNYAAACDLMCGKLDLLPAALTTARESDLIVAVFGEPQELSGEAASRARLTLSGKQAEVLEALATTGKPVVLVIIGGRPLELGSLAEKIPAILMAWYPGTEAGTAIADVLFGDANPSGKLPLSWPRTVGQAPIYYNRLPSGRPTLPNNRFTLNYIDEAISPLYPFGWGLGYSRFDYSRATIDTPSLAAGGSLRVSVDVTNAGERAGQEVVQLYIRDPVASRSRPLRQLKAFEKIMFQPGETKRITLSVAVENLGFHLDDGTYLVEEGVIQVFVGGHSNAEAVGEANVMQSIRLPLEDSRAGLSNRAAQ